MNYATLHTDAGERLNLVYSHEFRGGNSLFVFLQNLSIYHDDYENWKTTEIGQEIFRWFSNLEEATGVSIESLTHYLNKCHYLDQYFIEDYTLLSRVDASLEQRKKWAKISKEMEEMWVDIDPLLASVEKLVQLLETTSPKTTDWYYPDDTLVDFRALVETLTLAKGRGAKKIIIQFS